MNKKIMGSIVILMMTIVALNVVFADEEVCPCSKGGCSPVPPMNIENTNGNVHPMNTCMRSWIEYRNCTPKQWTWKLTKCVLLISNWGEMKSYGMCEGTWTQQCDKYRVWYNNCTHKVMYKEYLGRVTLSGSESHRNDWNCSCP